MLLWLCFGVLFAMANVIVGKTVLKGFVDARSKLSGFEAEQKAQYQWLQEREIYVPRYQWLDEQMPGMESSSKAGAQLLAEMQDQTHERKLRLERQNMLEAQTTVFYHEVSVHLQIEGDLKEMIDWITSLQQPEAFCVVKELELSLDTKSKEKEPQGRCNVVVARWFNPNASAEAKPESEPDAEPKPETEPESPSPELTVTE